MQIQKDKGQRLRRRVRTLSIGQELRSSGILHCSMGKLGVDVVGVDGPIIVRLKMAEEEFFIAVSCEAIDRLAGFSTAQFGILLDSLDMLLFIFCFHVVVE